MSFQLSTEDLEKFLSSDDLLHFNSGGVFPIDNLPGKITKKCFIINSDPSYLPGTHWFAIFFPKKSYPEFFDSLGRNPKFYSEDIINFLSKENKQIAYNCKRLQSTNSSTCGLFCLYFLYYRIRGYSFEKILESFGKNLKMNDLIVIDFYLKRLE